VPSHPIRRRQPRHNREEHSGLPLEPHVPAPSRRRRESSIGALRSASRDSTSPSPSRRTSTLPASTSTTPNADGRPKPNPRKVENASLNTRKNTGQRPRGSHLLPTLRRRPKAEGSRRCRRRRGCRPRIAIFGGDGRERQGRKAS
jgi:hypothetical protein